MSTERAHYVLPKDLTIDIKEIAGPRGSSAFVAETMSAAIRKRSLFEVVEELRAKPAWKDEDHPELAELGTESWVRQIRKSNDQHFQRVGKARKKK